MSYSQLLRARRIRKEPAARRQVSAQVAAARRDLATARILMEREDEWAYNIAYNAMHLAGRAVMFAEGYRPTAEGGHAAVVDFLRIRLGPSFLDTVELLDRMRRQRHRITYESVGVVTPTQIREAVGTAEEFIAKVEALLETAGE